MRRFTETIVLVGSLSMAACVEHSTDDADTDTDIPVELDGACPLNERVGLFSLVHEADYSAVDGEIHTAIVPTTFVEETIAAGGCRLLEPQNPFCDPPCSSGEACSQAGTCIPYPERLETGVVTLAGLEVDVVMSPRADKRYFETTLPHPVFRPGAAISLTSTGGELGPLALSGRGFAPLELIGSLWTVQAGQPLVVEWVVPEASDDETSFQLTINVDQHGTAPTVLACEGPDSGRFEVPATVIDALLQAGVSGFPVGHAYRRTLDSTATDTGCVEFQVRSHQSAQLEIAGHMPCTSTADCADGLSCDVMNETCV